MFSVGHSVDFVGQTVFTTFQTISVWTLIFLRFNDYGLCFETKKQFLISTKSDKTCRPLSTFGWIMSWAINSLRCPSIFRSNPQIDPLPKPKSTLFFSYIEISAFDIRTVWIVITATAQGHSVVFYTRATHGQSVSDSIVMKRVIVMGRWSNPLFSQWNFNWSTSVGLPRGPFGKAPKVPIGPLHSSTVTGASTTPYLPNVNWLVH